MIVAGLITIIAFIFYLTVDHYAETYKFLINWILPCKWITIGLLVIFIGYCLIELVCFIRDRL